MKASTFTSSTKVVSTVLFAAIVLACTEDSGVVQTSISQASVEARSRVSALYESRTLDFTGPDSPYSLSEATTDFGEILGSWQSQNVDIASNQLRVRIPANSTSANPAPSGSGNTVKINVPDGSEYEISYKVRFGPNFQWSRGGKVGFGFLIGDGNTGCDKANDGLGASVRLMWYNPTNQKNDSGTDTPYFRPYIYYRDMPNNCGDDFSKQSKMLAKNTWYNIKIRVKSNTNSSANGSVLITVDGVTLFSKNNIRFTTNNNMRKIREISFHTFRGGSDDYWGATSDGLIYYDDVQWQRIAP